MEWEESEGDKYGKEVMGVDGRQKKKKWTGRLCKGWENEEKRNIGEQISKWRVCAWMGRWRMLDKYVVADGAGWTNKRTTWREGTI